MRWLFAVFLFTCAPAMAAAPDDLAPARLAIRTKQFAQAVQLLEQDARGGSADAQYLLGLATWNGIGVRANRDAARDSLQHAAQSGHPAAAYALAALLVDGTSAERTEATAWIARAAAAGYAPAIALHDAHQLPLSDGRVATGLGADLRLEIARVAARNDDLPLLEAIGVAELVGRKDSFGRTLLFDAAAAFSTDAAQLLLRAGADVNLADDFGVTPLMLAAQHPRAAMTRLLLGKGARVDAADQAGRTALFRAAAGNSAEQVAVLHDAGAAIDHADLRGWTSFDLALQRDAPAALEALRAAGGRATNVVTARSEAVGIDAASPGILYRGWPPLAVAVARDDAAEIRRRVAAGADVEVLTPQGASPLQVAVESQSREAFRVLIELGANPRRKSPDGINAIERVVRAGDTALLATLNSAGVRVDASDGPQLLSVAVNRGDVSMTRALLAAGVSAATADRSRRTPLMHAARIAHAELVKLLLDRGAAANVTDSVGRTALWYAAAVGSMEVVEVLLSVHADADGADRDVETPLLAAIRAGSEPVVSRLLAAGADARGKNEKQPLRVAAELGQSKIVALLLDRKAPLDATDAFGETALMAAARNGDAATCMSLLSAGANPRLRNRDRATAAELAEARGFSKLAERLRA